MRFWKFLTASLFALVLVWATAGSAFSQCGVIATPSLNLPVDHLTPTLSMISTTRPNAGSNGCIQQLSIDEGFGENAIFYDTEDSEDIFVQHSLRMIALAFERTYYWQVQPPSDNGSTNTWSEPTSFTTAAQGGACEFADVGFPTNISPADGAQDVSLTPTLDIQLERPFAGDCHWDATIWVIATDEQMQNVVFDSDDDRQNLETFVVPAGILQPNTTYWWHAFVRDLSGIGMGLGSRATRLTTAPGGAGIECLLDVNGNEQFDDDEIKEAIRKWILGAPLAGGNGQTIDDRTILELIRKWVLGEQLDC